MDMTDLGAKLQSELVDARLKVETTYCELVESGKEASASLEREYLEAIDELNAKLAETKAFAAKLREDARSFASKYGKKIVIGGVIVLAILAAGYIIGFVA